jgi:predicted CXXCH cytochrome family protein
MALLELVVVLAFGALSAAIARRSGVSAPAAAVAFVVLSATVFVVAASRRPPRDAGAPARTVSSAAVGSGACRSCHPSEHQSWHRSFHRTMTRLGTDPSLRAPFDGRRLEVEGRSVELSRRDGVRYATLPDPDIVARETLAGNPTPALAAPLVTRDIVLATGSHHHEVFWVRGTRGNELRLLPITYLVAEGRYVPRRDAFLQPPDARQHAVRWNSNCIQCHATLGRPEHDEASDRFSTTAAELGIACEACHGPGGAHVARHRNPLTRFSSHLSDGADASIVNPARLPPERASEVCGQCHSYFVPKREDTFWTAGFSESYRPGDELERSRTLVRAHGTSTGGTLPIDAESDDLFWNDGTIRVGGREWNGIEASACFQRGSGKTRISCLSCHSMHESNPDDQLIRNATADAPCERCHTDIARNRAAHTHHAASSPGSSCLSCHMPFTTYALFKGIRSHRIDSPSVARSAKSGRPNACNLCHLDRSLAWTAEKLSAWYGANEKVLEGETVSAALGDLIAGDAAKRAILAWAFGRPEARLASRDDWQAAFLAELLDDPYAAVRKIAADSLSSLPGFSGFAADFTADPDQRKRARDRALATWKKGFVPRVNSLILVGAEGRDEGRLAELLRARDHTPTTIAE